MVSKSPHTGTVFESNSGGAFGPELKFAGYDGIIIKGQADFPAYLSIIDDEVNLESGEAFTGRGIFETERLLKETLNSPEAKTLSIGPAGENLVSHACIGSESYRQLSRLLDEEPIQRRTESVVAILALLLQCRPPIISSLNKLQNN